MTENDPYRTKAKTKYHLTLQRKAGPVKPPDDRNWQLDKICNYEDYIAFLWKLEE